MTELFTKITEVITNILKLFKTVGTSLMTNPLFQIMLGIILLYLLINLIFMIVNYKRDREYYSYNPNKKISIKSDKYWNKLSYEDKIYMADHNLSFDENGNIVDLENL